MTTTPLRVGVTAVAAGALVLSLGASAPAVTTAAPLHAGHVADADLPPTAPSTR